LHKTTFLKLEFDISQKSIEKELFADKILQNQIKSLKESEILKSKKLQNQKIPVKNMF
jgi:hypothetical protein